MRATIAVEPEIRRKAWHELAMDRDLGESLRKFFPNVSGKLVDAVDILDPDYNSDSFFLEGSPALSHQEDPVTGYRAIELGYLSFHNLHNGTGTPDYDGFIKRLQGAPRDSMLIVTGTEESAEAIADVLVQCGYAREDVKKI